MKPEKTKHRKLGPWVGCCSQKCWYALEERCRCKCGGANHGRGKTGQYGKLEDFNEISVSIQEVENK